MLQMLSVDNSMFRGSDSKEISENKFRLKESCFIYSLCVQTHISTSVARRAAFLTHARQ